MNYHQLTGHMEERQEQRMCNISLNPHDDSLRPTGIDLPTTFRRLTTW